MLIETWLLKIARLRACIKERRAAEKAFTVLENAYNVVNSVLLEIHVKGASGAI